MYCGSCLQDNALAAALHSSGVDIQLVPTYTPIRTDEADQSQQEVFFGGINVYLQQKLPWWGRLPGFLSRWLDNPRLIRWVTSRGMETNAALLGDLTVSMLQGADGNQRAEVERVVRWLDRHAQPELVQFSNVLIAACAKTIKERLNVPVLVTLQGDDLFLSDLGPEHQQAALQQIRDIDRSVDAYVVHSQFYADHMASFLGIDRAKFRQVPLAISSDRFGVAPDAARTGPPTIGYLARLAPEKGLHLLVEAFEQIRAQPETAETRLLIAGWLGADQTGYAEELFQRLRDQCGEESFEYRGAVSREEKRQFLADVDVVAVPTVFQEPKGLYVLESLASGKPVVQPNHGIFPELLASTAGGRLFEANDVTDLTRQLTELLLNEPNRRELGEAGQANVAERHSARVAAAALRRVYDELLGL